MRIATTIAAYCQGFISFFQPGTGRTHLTAPKAYDKGRNLANMITGGWW